MSAAWDSRVTAIPAHATSCWTTTWCNSDVWSIRSRRPSRRSMPSPNWTTSSGIACEKDAKRRYSTSSRLGRPAVSVYSFLPRSRRLADSWKSGSSSSWSVPCSFSPATCCSGRRSFLRAPAAEQAPDKPDGKTAAGKEAAAPAGRRRPPRKSPPQEADRRGRRPTGHCRRVASPTRPRRRSPHRPPRQTPPAPDSSPTVADARLVRPGQLASVAGHADQPRRSDRAGGTGGAPSQWPAALSRSRRQLWLPGSAVSRHGGRLRRDRRRSRHARRAGPARPRRRLPPACSPATSSRPSTARRWRVVWISSRGCRARRPGQVVQLGVRRTAADQAQHLVFSVTLDDRPLELMHLESPTPSYLLGLNRLGATTPKLGGERIVGTAVAAARSLGNRDRDDRGSDVSLSSAGAVRRTRRPAWSSSNGFASSAGSSQDDSENPGAQTGYDVRHEHRDRQSRGRSGDPCPTPWMARPDCRRKGGGTRRRSIRAWGSAGARDVIWRVQGNRHSLRSATQIYKQATEDAADPPDVGPDRQSFARGTHVRLSGRGHPVLLRRADGRDARRAALVHCASKPMRCRWAVSRNWRAARSARSIRLFVS